MIEAGVPSVMVGHIALPAYSRKLRPGIQEEEILPATVAPEKMNIKTDPAPVIEPEQDPFLTS